MVKTGVSAAVGCLIVIGVLFICLVFGWIWPVAMLALLAASNKGK